MGIGEEVSQGFLDGDNIPPWDTWISLFDGETTDEYLLSWVPGAFVGLVSETLKDKNRVDETISWWGQYDRPFTRQVIQGVNREYPSIRIGVLDWRNW